MKSRKAVEKIKREIEKNEEERKTKEGGVAEFQEAIQNLKDQVEDAASKCTQM